MTSPTPEQRPTTINPYDPGLVRCLEERVRQLEAALREVAAEVTCRCVPDYTERGRHEPNALCYVEGIARAALTPATEEPR